MIVILGILAALVVPRVLERPDEARAVAAKSDIAAILAALKLYRLDNQRYPTSEQGLAALTARPTQPPRSAQLEAERLPRATAQGPVGPAVSISESGAARRDRRLQLRRRRTAGRDGDRHRYRVVGPLMAGAKASRLHADRGAGRHRGDCDCRRVRRRQSRRRRPAHNRAGSIAPRRRARARGGAGAVAQRDAGLLRRRRRAIASGAAGRTTAGARCATRKSSRRARCPRSGRSRPSPTRARRSPPTSSSRSGRAGATSPMRSSSPLPHGHSSSPAIR